MKSVTIVSEDKVGLLADISYVLGKAKVNIESISVDVVAGKAIITLTIQDPMKAKDVLERNGYTVAESNVLVIKLADKPGELSKITNMLAGEHVSIHNVHMLSRDGKNTVLAIIVDKPKKASKMLDEYLINKQS